MEEVTLIRLTVDFGKEKRERRKKGVLGKAA